MSKSITIRDVPDETGRELATRAWELRKNLTIYDGWCVALAELLDVELATLDRRLGRAPGVRCPFRLPPDDRSRSGPSPAD